MRLTLHGTKQQEKDMQFKGSPEFEVFWNFLADETPRGRGVVVAAFFDEKLGDLLAQSQSQSFSARINAGLAGGLLTQNEHDDLHVFRVLRNSFAHDLRAKAFDAVKIERVNSLKTWQIALEEGLVCPDWFPLPDDRLLYVAGVIAARLNYRTSKASGPLPEPSILDTKAWPPVTSSY